MIEAKKRRRSLTHVGGDVELEGDAHEAKLLARALDVPPPPEQGEGPERAHVHGFHAYPARMHPVTAARLVEDFAPARGVVLDPFCGSGTVLVEAMIAARDARGTDLNPLAVRLARFKTAAHSRAELEATIEAARAVAAHAEARRKARAGATRRYPPSDVALFEPHVLLELDGLRDGIGVAPPETRPALDLVLSALLTKSSKKRGETSGQTDARRTAAGYTSKLFVKKTEELARRVADLALLLPKPRPRCSVDEDDATRLRAIPSGSIDAVVTSPPYVATYDYLEHHALRMRWLNIDTRALERGELGARRNYAQTDPDEAKERWGRELSAFLEAMARVLKPRTPAVLLMADSAIGRAPIRADDAIAALAPRAGFTPIARASQTRPHFHGPTQRAFEREPRKEHALLIVKR
jgi:DNA modification methylase